MKPFYTNVQYEKGKILYSGYSAKGKRQIIEHKGFKPYLFEPTTQESKYRTIHGDPVKKRVFESGWEAYQYQQKFDGVSGFEYYGITDFKYLFIYENFNRCKYDPSLIKECVLDIEVSTKGGASQPEDATQPITSICMQYEKETFVFGTKEFVSDDPKIKYFKFDNEIALLRGFLDFWDSPVHRPDVVTGWYIDGYDIPYIINRLTRLFSLKQAQRLSPWKKLRSRTIETDYGEKILWEIVGVSSLDYRDLYIKFVSIVKPQESYSLNHISFVELDAEKLDYSEFGNLDDLYEKDHQLFIEYNIRDCDLVFRMNKKLRLLNLIYHIAYRMGVNYQDALKTVVPWDVAIHNYLMDRCVVVPQSLSGEVRKLPGGFVLPAKSGMHDWIVSFDLTSMYPMRIIGSNIGPDTAVTKQKLLNIINS